MKKEKDKSSAMDKAMAKAGSAKKQPQTEEPIAEKDEVKMAEEELRKRLKKQKDDG